MKILKAKSDEIMIGELRTFIKAKQVDLGKFGISWKIGKKRKIRTYQLIRIDYDDYEDTYYPWTEITIGKGDKKVMLDDSVGPWSFSINTLTS